MIYIIWTYSNSKDGQKQMFIKYDKHDLLELFLSEPISLTKNLGDGGVSYVKSGENEFQLAINTYAYQMKCTISQLLPTIPEECRVPNKSK